jgi:hypothetical protein
VGDRVEPPERAGQRLEPADLGEIDDEGGAGRGGELEEPGTVGERVQAGRFQVQPDRQAVLRQLGDGPEGFVAVGDQG